MSGRVAEDDPGGVLHRVADRPDLIRDATYGPDHPVVSTRLAQLALILHDLGQDEAAQRMQERARAIAEAAYGPDR